MTTLLLEKIELIKKRCDQPDAAKLESLEDLYKNLPELFSRSPFPPMFKTWTSPNGEGPALPGHEKALKSPPQDKGEKTIPGKPNPRIEGRIDPTAVGGIKKSLDNQFFNDEALHTGTQKAVPREKPHQKIQSPPFEQPIEFESYYTGSNMNPRFSAGEPIDQMTPYGAQGLERMEEDPYIQYGGYPQMGDHLGGYPPVLHTPDGEILYAQPMYMDAPYPYEGEPMPPKKKEKKGKKKASKGKKKKGSEDHMYPQHLPPMYENYDMSHGYAYDPYAPPHMRYGQPEYLPQQMMYPQEQPPWGEYGYIHHEVPMRGYVDPRYGPVPPQARPPKKQKEKKPKKGGKKNANGSEDMIGVAAPFRPQAPSESVVPQPNNNIEEIFPNYEENFPSPDDVINDNVKKKSKDKGTPLIIKSNPPKEEIIVPKVEAAPKVEVVPKEEKKVEPVHNDDDLLEDDDQPEFHPQGMPSNTQNSTSQKSGSKGGSWKGQVYQSHQMEIPDDAYDHMQVHYPYGYEPERHIEQVPDYYGHPADPYMSYDPYGGYHHAPQEYYGGYAPQTEYYMPEYPPQGYMAYGGYEDPRYAQPTHGRQPIMNSNQYHSKFQGPGSKPSKRGGKTQKNKPKKEKIQGGYSKGRNDDAQPPQQYRQPVMQDNDDGDDNSSDHT